ncbi:MAG: hypothetical protein WC325_05915 [Candidatus Bathyarchaeia archaeon]
MSEINWGNYTEAYKAIHDAVHGIRSCQSIVVTHNSAGYITQIRVSNGEVTKTITVTRDSANFIEQISENLE